MNAITLAVDTTSEYGSLALLRGGETLEETALHAPSGFAQVLFAAADSLLKRNGVSLAAVDCFAAANGPGSFTGVRVGVTFVKGLSEALGKPCVAVSSLKAVAAFGSAGLRAAVIDARRGQVYGAVYDAAGTLLGEETVGDFREWIRALPASGLEFVCADFETFRDLLVGTPLASAQVVTAPRAQAAAIGRIAAAAFTRGEAVDPVGINANYVRRSDAELFWKE